MHREQTKRSESHKNFIDRVNEVSIYHDPHMSKANFTKGTLDRITFEEEPQEADRREPKFFSRGNKVGGGSVPKRADSQRHGGENYRNKYKNMLEVVELEDPYSNEKAGHK